jgi:ABC-type multidrug transport system ATPase subunit
MRIDKLNVKNKVINIEDVDIDFSGYGVYLIRGENGSGKTSLIEEIIFNKNNISFDSEEQRKAYEKDRYNLFTYIPQNIIPVIDTVMNYINKSNSACADSAYLEKLLKMFGLDPDILNQRFNQLSGGEKEKTSIICGLLKDTPYIFMDEPTNNLDDSTVNMLVKLIEELSKRKTIIIITHDPRLKVAQFTELTIKNNKLSINSNHTVTKIEKNINFQVKNNSNYLKLGTGLFKNAVNIITVFTTLAVVVLLSLYTQLQFEAGYSTDVAPSENVILAYKAECVYGELNKVYVKHEKLKINEDNIYTMISYNDISHIANIDGIEKIIIVDSEYIDKLYEKLSDDALLDLLHFMAVPSIISKGFSDPMMTPYDLDYLSKGRLPLDNSFEVSLSKDILMKFFNYSEEQIDNAIGDTININNQVYTIVGLHYLDMCFISYEDNLNYGFYMYDPETYYEFHKRNMEHNINVDRAYPDTTDELIIFTSSGKEKNVLNQLFVNYPANNYLSSEYSKSWVKEFNSSFVMKITRMNVIFAVIIGIALMIINGNQYALSKKRILDYENYYIKKKSIKRVYVSFIAFQYAIILIVSVIINNLLNSFSYASDFITIINVLVISLFVISYSIVVIYHNKSKKIKA